MLVPDTFRRAVAAYEREDLAKAERLCKAPLKSKPDSFDALHFLSVTQSRQSKKAAATNRLAPRLPFAAKTCPPDKRESCATGRGVLRRRGATQPLDRELGRLEMLLAAGQRHMIGMMVSRPALKYEVKLHG
jgi:hypothetical protein